MTRKAADWGAGQGAGYGWAFSKGSHGIHGRPRTSERAGTTAGNDWAFSKGSHGIHGRPRKPTIESPCPSRATGQGPNGSRSPSVRSQEVRGLPRPSVAENQNTPYAIVRYTAYGTSWPSAAFRGLPWQKIQGPSSGIRPPGVRGQHLRVHEGRRRNLARRPSVARRSTTSPGRTSEFRCSGPPRPAGTRR